MMSWNYRVMHFDTPIECEDPATFEPFYGFIEAYYDEEGKLKGWTAKPVEIIEESLDELGLTLGHLQEAYTLPVLVRSIEVQNL